jgi:uncharacterized Rmd1/YagE family protein
MAMDGHHSDAEVNYRSIGITSATMLPPSTTLLGGPAPFNGHKKKNKFPRFRSKHESKNSSATTEPRPHSRSQNQPSDRPSYTPHKNQSGNISRDDDDSDQDDVSSDEFGVIRPLIDEQSIVTGRMRKRHVARSKGGEFRSHRQKRRLYTCCISPTIKIQELYHHLARDIFSSKSIWTVSILGDVIILSKCRDVVRSHDYDTAEDISVPLFGSINIVHPENQTVFIFEFGAVVFWGFSNGEEKQLLGVFRRFADEELLFHGAKFQKGEDDMAFVSSTKRSQVAISNDVIILPSVTHEDITSSSGLPSGHPSALVTETPAVTYLLLLSVSFAIAQSAVVSIFEHRIEMKITEYKFIPETLARGELINLSDEKLGQMIGDIFQIKHDLNLHTDILDIPDALWAANDDYLTLYDRCFRYLEVSSRVEVINKRINMQKEVLEMLLQHFQADHISNLNTIIIWLLVFEAVVQVFGGGGMLLGFWGHRAE